MAERPDDNFEWPTKRVVKTKGVVVGLFGIARSTFDQWLANGLPGKVEGGWDLLWIIRHLQQERAKARMNRTGGVTGDDDPGSRTRGELEKEKLEIQNRALMLELRKKQEELIEVAAVESEVRSMITAVRQRLQAIPGELAAMLPTELRAEFVDDAAHHMENVCREMSEWGEKDG